MSLSNVFYIKEFLEEAIENKKYDKVMKLMNKLLNENNAPFDVNEINGIKFF